MASGMDQDLSRQASVRAGVIAGVAGFAVFLLIHHLWIVPIWFIARVGGLLAAAGGAAVGGAYAVSFPTCRDVRGPLIAVITLVAVVLFPAIVIAEVRAPIFVMDRSGRGTFLAPGTEVAVEFFAGLRARRGPRRAPRTPPR